MRVISFSEARNTLKSVIDRVIHDADVTVIKRRNDPDAIIMSLDCYNSLMETVHLIKTICFTEAAWEDYVWWQRQDQKTLRRINQLIHNACRTPFEGLGKPEPLRESLSGFWSRRIDQANRLVYEDTDRALNVVSCRYHYG